MSPSAAVARVAAAVPELVPVRASDGVHSQLRLFPGVPSLSRVQPVVFCLPAMGVPARFYDPFGHALAARGLAVAVADLRGHGSSSVRPGRGVDFGYAEMVERDWPAAVAAVRARFANRPLIALGHSLGGHVQALATAASPDAVAALVLVASGSPDWRGFPLHRRPLVAAVTQLAPLVAAAVGHFPGEQVGFGGREARRLVGDWSRLARSGRFSPTGATRDYEAALAELKHPALAIAIEGDAFAPPAAVARLCQKLPAAQLEHRRWLPPRKSSRPSRRAETARWHFQWARRPDAIADEVAAYVTRLY
jgi:predicted alpha/beta hydrolase